MEEGDLALETGPSLRPIYAFGFEAIPGKNKQMVCIDEHTIAYALGCNLVFHNFLDKTMHFIVMNSGVQSIVSLTSTPSGSLVAVCEKMKTGHGQISIVDTKKLKVVQTLISTSPAELEVCALSKNEQKAVAVTKNVKGSVICWELEHGKVLTTIPIFVEITGVTVNPHDSDEFATCGPTHFRIWSLKGGTTKSFAVPGLQVTNQALTLTDHDWLQDGGLAVSTVEDMILIVRDGRIESKLVDTGHTLRLVATRNGFLTGRDDGTLTDFKARGRPPVYTGTVLTRTRGPISCIALPPNVDALAYVQQEGIVLKVDYADFESEGPKDLMDMHVIDLAAVSGMDICVRRRLIATCSNDKMVRVWSYCRLLCDLTYACHEQPSSIAISPWGYELAVGMAYSSILLFGIMASRLEPRREVALQGCGAIKYSPSGDMVAALCGREIVIYSSFTWEVLTVLKGHINKVTSIAWSSNSVHLASAGLDGATYRWAVDDFRRHEECVTKGSQYASILYDHSRYFLYSCGPGLPLRIISTSNKPPPEILNTFPNEVIIGVWDGTGDGDWANRVQGAPILVRASRPTKLWPTCRLFPEANGRIAAMCVDETHNIVFIRSTKGTIFICTLDDGKISAERPTSLLDFFTDQNEEGEIENWLLIRRSELEEAGEEAQNLKSSLQAEQDESQYRQHRIRQDWAAKIKEKEKEHAKRERELVLEMQTLKEKLEAAEKNLEHTTQTFLESQSQAMGTLYEHFEEKFTGETARAEHWRTKAEQVKESCVKEIEHKEKVHTTEVLGLQSQIDKIESHSRTRMQKLQEDCEREIRKYKTYMDEDLLINDEELVVGFSQMKQAMQAQQKHIDDARAQMLLEKKAATSYQLQITELSTLCTAQDSNIRHLEIEKARLENFALEFDYKKRILDKLVEEADEHRKALLHATKERETLAVLQHSKIQQLVEREKPLVAELSQYKSKIQEMQARESLDVKHRLAQEEAARLLTERIQDLEQRVFRLLHQLGQKEEYLDAFKEALCVIVHDHDPGEWPPLTRGLFLAYVKGSERAAVAEGLESRSQIMKQRQILEDFVVVLKTTIDRTKDRCKEEMQHFVKENLNLLRDFCEANRNSRRMAFMVQKLQQQVAYFKGIVSMQKRSLARARQSSSRPSTPEKRRSIITAEPRRSSSFVTSGIQRRIRLSRESDALRLPARPPTPVSEILKPYSRFSIVHGDQDHTRRMTTSQIEKRMSKPWGTAEPERKSNRIQVDDLLRQLEETRSELGKKQGEINVLQAALAAKQRSRPGTSLGFNAMQKKGGVIARGRPK
ncbi:hypothetical protein SELMODRAFT_437796 [Selaginella moellendorffii]|uniref:Cilia- and flagella-associated protein 57 n=1 Tax=Selaginella moellendorffii TaxID=88036 RepID=D8QTR7_SELML|nr:hypothetical protein SELMODRAFT_437796 [Selaginella moellendorffii]